MTGPRTIKFYLAEIQGCSQWSKIIFFYRGGKCSWSWNWQNIKKKGYDLLATVQVEPILRKNENVLTHEDILVTSRYLQKQTKTTKTDYHFGTTGHIYGFGYGPIYSSNQKTQHTVDKFAKSKLF